MADLDDRIYQIAQDTAHTRGVLDQVLPALEKQGEAHAALLAKHGEALTALSNRVDAHEGAHRRQESLVRNVFKTANLALSGLAATVALIVRELASKGPDVWK